jgi:hypothetical protein
MITNTGEVVSQYNLPFSFHEISDRPVKGWLDLEPPLPYEILEGSGFFRPGKLSIEGGAQLDLVLYNNPATTKFIYLRKCPVDLNLLNLIGLEPGEVSHLSSLVLPGQLCMGSERSNLIGQAIRHMVGAPALRETLNCHQQQNLAIFPIAREGLKYQVTEAIFETSGFYCDEIVLDAHHVFDSSVPIFNRTVEFTLFKDKDLDRQQKDNISVAFIADSIASGLVMKEVIAKVMDRFEHIEQVEVIAPLATIRGLCNIGQSAIARDIRVRVHVFETLLNALPPDYYYSSHYNTPDLHIRPDLDRDYRDWWGLDRDGQFIADTACAGYGWSEVFYSPRKQIKMINSQLESRHGLTIADIVRRNLEKM